MSIRHKMTEKKINGNLTGEIKTLNLFKSSFAFISVVIILFVLSVSLIFKSAFCYAGTNNIKALHNKAAKKAKKKSDKNSAGNNIAYPYFLKRDPFQTFLYRQSHISSFKEGELPLLQYAVASLKVVGIMSRRGKYFAMIQTPDGRSYIVTDGSLIGVSRARVVSITSNAVTLTERTYNILGQLKTMNVVMLLK